MIIIGLFHNVSETEGMGWIGLALNGASGWQWEDNSEVVYTNWNNGQPNNNNDVSEKCVQIQETGFWKIDSCAAAYSYACKKIVETEYCALAKTGSLNMCGFIGITERECMLEWNCCYDQNVDVEPGHHCFKPKTPINTGLTAGVAVGITVLVLATCGGAYFYITKYGRPC